MKRVVSLRYEHLCVIAILAITALFFHLSLVTHWDDSELWAISVSRLFSLDSPDRGSHYKIAFHSILKCLYFLPLDNLQTIIGARLEFALLGAATALLLVLLEREFRKNMVLPGIAALLFCSSSYFLSQGHRVRSDLLATFFQICSLWVSIRFLREPQKNAGLFISAIAILNLLMFLSTPKAIYQFFVNAAIAVTLAFSSPVRKTHLFLFFSVLFGPVLLATLLIVWHWDSYLTAAAFFFKSFQGEHGHPPYFSRIAFVYVIRFFTQNPLLVLLWVGAVVSSLKNWRKGDSFSRALALGSVLSVAFIVLHNDRLPFFVLSLLPLPILHLALFLDQKLQGVSSFWKYAVIVAAFAGATYWYSWQQVHNSNKQQKQALQTIESYLERYPRATYYDEAAILPRTNKIFLKIEPSHEGNSHLLFLMFREERPDLVFLSNGLFHHFAEVMKYLDENYYIQVGNGVFARAKFLPSKSGKEINFNTLCVADDSGPSYLYIGPNFMEMNVINNIDEIESLPQNALIACSYYGPISFPDGLSFAQIFDFGGLDFTPSK